MTNAYQLLLWVISLSSQCTYKAYHHLPMCQLSGIGVLTWCLLLIPSYTIHNLRYAIVWKKGHKRNTESFLSPLRLGDPNK
jgi:hypothetical protein